MPDMMESKLGAYLDGELSPHSRLELEVHLQSCAECRAELESLSQLSHLLHNAPQPEFASPSQFKAQVILCLPERPEERRESAPRTWYLWLAPAITLGGWLFLQVTLGLSSIISLARQAGLLAGASTWLSNSPLQMTWFGLVQSTLGGLLAPAWLNDLAVVNDINLLLRNLVVIFLIQLGVGLLYWVSLLLVARRGRLEGSSPLTFLEG